MSDDSPEQLPEPVGTVAGSGGRGHGLSAVPCVVWPALLVTGYPGLRRASEAFSTQPCGQPPRVGPSQYRK